MRDLAQQGRAPGLAQEVTGSSPVVPVFPFTKRHLKAKLKSLKKTYSRNQAIITNLSQRMRIELDTPLFRRIGRAWFMLSERRERLHAAKETARQALYDIKALTFLGRANGLLDPPANVQHPAVIARMRTLQPVVDGHLAKRRRG